MGYLRPATSADLTILRVFPGRIYRIADGDWRRTDRDRLHLPDWRWDSYASDPCVSTLRVTLSPSLSGPRSYHPSSVTNRRASSSDDWGFCPV